jgi:tetratricopeptide (TPR) repeat protein
VDPWNFRTHGEATRLANQLISARSPLGSATPGAKPEAPAVEFRSRRDIPRMDGTLATIASDPNDPMAWRALEILGNAVGARLERHADVVPYELLRVSQEGSLESPRLYARVPAEAAGAWKEYAQARRMLQADGMQRSRDTKTAYHLSAAEETRALEAAASWWRSAREQDPSLRNDHLDFLCALQSERMLAAYVFLERFAEPFRPEFELWKQREPGKTAEYVYRWLLRPGSKAGSSLERSLSPCMLAEFTSTEVKGLSGSESVPALKDPLGTVLAPSAAQAKRIRLIGLFNQAIQLHRANELDKAIVMYRKCLAVDPYFPTVHQNLALIYFNRGNMIQAASHAELGSALEPGSIPLIYLATQSYIQLQLYDCAAFCIRRALQQPLEAGEKAGLLDRQAYVYILIREWDKAERKLKEASELDGQNAEIRQHIELLKRMRSQPKPSDK